MPYFTPEQCAKLHTCFLKDIAKQCRKLDADIVVCYTPEDKYKILPRIFGEKVYYQKQSGNDLGSRMYQAIDSVLARGYESCILIGTDLPEISVKDMETAFAVLDTKDVVLGPTSDGGYYLVGMKFARKEVFENQTYGHGNVLQNTIYGLKQQNLSVGLGNAQSDIDTKEDIWKYREKMREKKALQKTATGKYLIKTARISIIVPIYNEEKTISALQEQLRKKKDKCEILFVDGGSTDRTLELIGNDFCVIHSKKGRAGQMNLGAKKSTGDILFFLHCDSELPEHPLEQIRWVMKDYRFGCFGIAFHSRNFFLFTCRIISNHRIKDRKIVFGDQGMFIDRNLFFEMGMFPELPIMEDYQFSLNLKANGEKIGMTKKRIYTSDRRFPKGTVPKLREMWKMNRLRKKYRDGIDIRQIAAMYQDVR
jgi:rSAM/selenodomain-associated transferase 2/rSAM/selenodomain-associated transferase 1